MRSIENLRFVLVFLICVSHGASAAFAQSTYDPYFFVNLSGSPGCASVDGTRGTARFCGPEGVVVDNAGNIYVADESNHTIREITPAGIVSTLAGLAGNPGSADGTGSAARFRYPSGVAVDNAENVYVADTENQTIRKITPAGDVTTLAGLAGVRGSDDGTGSDARFNDPFGVAVDGLGNVYVADTGNHTIRRITAAGVVSTLAGLAGMQGSDDGNGADARFSFPFDVAVDDSGNVYVADTFNYTIREITPAGDVTTLAGLAGNYGSADGTGGDARFSAPHSVAVDCVQNIYVADTSNSTVRKITAARVVTTLAGLAGTVGNVDGSGSDARFWYPVGVAVDNAGNVYLADLDNNNIRVGTATTFAIWRTAFFDQQQLNDPSISGYLADPDGDGLQNLLEYALNLNPNVSSTGGSPQIETDSNYVSLVYTRVPGATDLTYTIEQSRDLLNGRSLHQRT
jgi:NHL repeat